MCRVARDIRIPLGTWPEDPKQKQNGLICVEATVGDLEGMSSRALASRKGTLTSLSEVLTLLAGYVLYVVSQLAGWSEEEGRALIAHARAQFREPGVSPYSVRRIIWAGKPESSE